LPQRRLCLSQECKVDVIVYCTRIQVRYLKLLCHQKETVLPRCCLGRFVIL